MPLTLSQLVTFRSDKLFNGAVNVDWFGTEDARADAAAQAYVFHGPEYHGVSQLDVGIDHGHRLVDTARFTLSLVKRAYGIEDQPFTLAIAGYGTGKSHLALSIATLLSDPKGQTAARIVKGVDEADSTMGAELRAVLDEASQPCLVVALNGMKSFDLTAEITGQVIHQLKKRELDTRVLDELRPRFLQAAALIRMSNEEIRQEISSDCGLSSIEDVLHALEQQDERIYSSAHKVFSNRGMPITALRGESVHDILDTVVKEYCGSDKPFHSVVIIFDEFGKYTEFATVRSQIAGTGVLQDLFEGVQANNSRVCFAGFIQFELAAYVQRIAPEYRNEILRYVTRYQAASRVYLSINLETLIANLIEKNHPDPIAEQLDGSEAKRESERTCHDLLRWFPQARMHRLWNDPGGFHQIIRRGCWPLTAYSTWFLFHLAAAGKHLQERSALALLAQALEKSADTPVPEIATWGLAPADLWSESLQQELLTAEEGGQQGAITHAYASVEAKHGASLGADHRRLLRAVVVASKMGLQPRDRGDAVVAMARLSGLYEGNARDGLRTLQEEYNVIEWDDAFKQFDILGDAIPRTQFLAFLRQRTASSFDDRGKAALFASKATLFCELLSDLECDFAEENKITTREWRYRAASCSLDTLPMHLNLAASNWERAVGVDDPRGTILYCYLEPDRDASEAEVSIARAIRAVAKEKDIPALPILVVLLHDEDGMLGQALAELAVLSESLTEEDRVRFGNLVGAHTEKQKGLVRTLVDALMKQRRYVTGLKEPLESQRLSRVATELFGRIYSNPLTFPFDGFTTAKGNAAESCYDLSRELLLGRLDYDAVMGKPVRVKNRAITVLKDAWGVFGQNGAVLKRPNHRVLRNLTTKWDDMLATGERCIPLESALKELCGTPSGANLASAALALGVFVAPRYEKLLVFRGNQQLSISEWLQDGLFRAKFIDLSSLSDVTLIPIGEESSEWETLLEEWEQAPNYAARIDGLQRANELKKRIPVPPSLAYREVHLQSVTTDALRAVAEMDAKQSDAIEKIEYGRERNNLSQVSWGAASLAALIDQMEDEEPLWDSQEIEKLRLIVERAKQEITQVFPSWLSSQQPRSDSLDAVGDYRHKMSRQCGGNLRSLGLDGLAADLDKHVNQAIRNVETAQECRQLIRDARSWILKNQGATRISQVAELRALLDAGRELTQKLQGMTQRLPSQELGEVRTELSQFHTLLKEALEQLLKRARRLLNTHIRSLEDLDAQSQEVEALVRAFENCPTDLSDLQLMRRALRTYHEAREQLADERLTWPEFERLAERIKSDTTQVIQEDDVPWPPSQVIEGFVDSINKDRKLASREWIERIETEAAEVETMSAPEANRLEGKLTMPPAVLTEPHQRKLESILHSVHRRLDSLKIEWLFERFKELSPELREKFLRLIDRN